MKRNISLDILRILAIFFVIMAHVFEDAYNLPDLEHLSFSNVDAWSAYLGFTFGRLGVPIFLMLTGFFLVDRDWTQERISQFYRNNLLKLFVTWELWIAIYFLYSRFYLHANVDGGTYFQQAFFVEPVNMPNAWYMPMILGIYLFLPHVSITIKQMNSKILIFMSVLLGIYLFLVPTINQTLLIFKLPAISNQLDLSFSGGYYAMYVVLGYYMKKLKDQNFRLPWGLDVIVTIALIVMTAGYQVLAYRHGVSYNVWYDFIMLPLVSVFLFSLFNRLKIKVSGTKAIVDISNSSFGIFLIHYPIFVAMKYYLLPLHKNFGYLVLLSLIVYLVSLLIVYPLQKTRLGKWIFYK